MMNKRSWIAVFAAIYTAGLPVSAQEQLPNLPDAPKGERFALTDRTWPAKAGDADICLWADDRFAAISFTVDDNSYPNVEWWMDTAKKHGLKVTWFLITERITKNENAGFNGTWEQWNKVVASSHDVQSHTRHHLHTELPEWNGIEAEYRDSQEQIEACIPGHRCEFLAYPGGKNKTLNDRTVASKYYAAGRGGSGMINTANRIDYFAVNTMSAFTTTNPATPWSNLPSLFDVKQPKYFRGWAVCLNHLINDYNSMTPVLAFFDKHKDQLWCGLFGDVAKYGQERDTAMLKVDENTDARIALTLTDRMLDSRFDYPLTVKVRLPAVWTKVQALQNGQTIKSGVIEHEGALYALVNAVPDRGQIILSPASF